MAQLESSPESTLREGPISLMTCLAPTSNAGGMISSRMLCTRYSLIRFSLSSRKDQVQRSKSLV